MSKTSKELLTDAINRSQEIKRLLSIRKETESFWREQIAKEIETQIESLSLGDGLFKSGMIGAAAIARGKR